MHGGHRALGQVSHPAERRAEHLTLPQDLRVGHGVAFLEVRARAERLRPRGAEHDRPDAPFVAEVPARGSDGLSHRGVQRVECVRAVKHDLRNEANASVLAHGNTVIVHSAEG